MGTYALQHVWKAKHQIYLCLIILSPMRIEVTWWEKARLPKVSNNAFSRQLNISLEADTCKHPKHLEGNQKGRLRQKWKIAKHGHTRTPLLTLHEPLSSSFFKNSSLGAVDRANQTGPRITPCGLHSQTSRLAYQDTRTWLMMQELRMMPRRPDMTHAMDEHG